MDTAEGPRQVYEVLCTRWKTAPRVILYDNACQLATYALARDPKHFGDTAFIVDRLHYEGHVRCSPAFNPAQYDSLIGELNT